MSFPTEGVLFSASNPPAPPGQQLCRPQTDGEQPAQRVTFVMPLATDTDAGAVKADGTSITMDADGTLHAPGGTPGGGGPGGGGPSASGGALVCVVPSGAKDGTNLQYTIPAPVLAGNDPLYFRNGIKQRQQGTKAEFAIQGTQLTVAPSPITQPLQSDDWHELHYVMGQPNSETGGGGSVTPLTGVIEAWPMNDGSGLTLHGAVAANNATLDSGAVTWQSNDGMAGLTAYWNGSGQAQAPNSLANFDGSAPFSVSVWVDPKSFTGAAAFIGDLNTPTFFGGWELGTDVTPNKVTFYLIEGVSTSEIGVHSTNSLTANALNFVVVTYDGSKTAAGVKIYLNGVLETPVVMSDNLTGATNNTRPLCFGARVNGTNPFAGVMAYLELYAGVITAAQVTASYAAGPQIYL